MKPLNVERVLWIKKGQGIAACGRIPEDSAFFKDHFPGFPVLPGVLALEMLKQTAECYLREVHKKEDIAVSIKKIQATKFSLYLKPGDEWESQLQLLPPPQDQEGWKQDFVGEKTLWKASLLHKGRIAVTTRLTLETVEAKKVLDKLVLS